ncbi:MAG: carboxypeptidase-like regulatory domain-containing protein [Planctomycetota bacterium]
MKDTFGLLVLLLAVVVAAIGISIALGDDGAVREQPAAVGGDAPARAAGAPAAGAPRDSLRRSVGAAARDGAVDDGAPGEVHVLVRYEDGAAAPGVGLLLRPFGDDDRLRARHGVTDAAGEVAFATVLPGGYSVTCDRAVFDLGSAAWFRLAPRQTAKVTLRLPVLQTIAGVVQNRAGQPIGGAEVWLGQLATVGRDAEAVAHTDEWGRFSIPCGFQAALVGARASGYAPSRLQFVGMNHPIEGGLRLLLPELGGDCVGTVRDADGAPVEGALVRIGAGRLDGIAIGDSGPPLPTQVRTDADGGFVAAGLAVGDHPVCVRAPGLGAFEGRVLVETARTSRCDVVLGAATAIEGVVRGGGGAPVAEAMVECGVPGSLLHWHCATDAAGTYRLDGLAPGPVTVKARAPGLGRGTCDLQCRAGEVTRGDLVLVPGAELRGVVRTDAGAPVVGARVTVWAAAGHGDGGGASKVRTDGHGAFAVEDLAARVVDVRVVHAEIEDLHRAAVDTGAGVVDLVARSREPATAFVTGTVRGPDREPVELAEVTVVGEVERSLQRAVMLRPEARGAFELGPLPPGTYELRVEVPRHPRLTRRVVLGANERVAVPDLRAGPGGRIRAQCGGVWPDAMFLGIFGADGAWIGSITASSRDHCSELLEPGSYRVCTMGEGVARAVQTVEVQAGADARVDCSAGPGLRRDLAVTGLGRARHVALRLQGPTGLLMDDLVPTSDGALRETWWLPPGAYRVSAEAGGMRRALEFEVTAAAADAEDLHIDWTR